MPPIEPQEAQDWIAIALSYYGHYPVIATLIVLMFVDILTGTMAAAAQGAVSSKVSMGGAVKKSFVLIIVGVAAVLERLQADLPLSKLAATFFIFTEGMSILENARRCGVPIPKALSDALQNLNNVRQAESDTTVVKTTESKTEMKETTETTQHKSEPPHPDHSSSWIKKNGKPVPSQADVEKHGSAVIDRLRREAERKEGKDINGN